jgi:serine protease Do
VLVGLNIWETATNANVDYVLNRPDLGEHPPVKFYILRGSQTLYGQMPAPLGR